MKQNISHCIIGKSACHLVLMLVMLFSGFDNAAYADDVTISTNDNGYYEISTAAQLKKFADMVNGGDENIKGVLTADIDVSTLGTEYWTPNGLYAEGSESHAFTGTFNGQGHTISGIVLRKTAASGLFGYVNGATISNVVVSGAQMKATSDTRVASIQDAIAPVCGLAIGGTMISGCSSTMTEILYKVRNEDDQKDINYVGGIVGEMRHSTVQNCTVDGFVRTDGECVGGIVGLCYMSQVTNCHLQDYEGGHSAVVGKQYVGGIVGTQRGRFQKDAIVDCTVADESIVKATSAWGDTICGINRQILYESEWEPYNGTYEIYTPEQMLWFSHVVNNGNNSAKAKLMNDIKMKYVDAITPIGTEDNPFAGEFDGQGFTIDSLTIVDQEYAGMFGYVKDGSIKNFTLNHPYLTTDDNDYLGLVAGFLTQNKGHETVVGYIENVNVKNGRLTRGTSSARQTSTSMTALTRFTIPSSSHCSAT